MLKSPEGFTNEINNRVWNLDTTYTLQPYDIVSIEIFNKGGEILIDPELRTSANANVRNNLTQNITYQINADGTLKLPMIDEIKIGGLTLRQAEISIEKEFTTYYEKVFVNLQYRNKRAYVVGSNGGQVIPLTNENTTIIEVIALAGGISDKGRADNVRLVRQQEVIVGNLTTIEGFKLFNKKVMPGDVIYIEPIRRPVAESLRDYGSIVGLLSGIISLTALIISFR